MSYIHTIDRIHVYLHMCLLACLLKSSESYTVHCYAMNMRFDAIVLVIDIKFSPFGCVFFEHLSNLLYCMNPFTDKKWGKGGKEKVDDEDVAFKRMVAKVSRSCLLMLELMCANFHCL